MKVMEKAKRRIGAATWFKYACKACDTMRGRTDGRCEDAVDGCHGIGLCDYAMRVASEGKPTRR